MSKRLLPLFAAAFSLPPKPLNLDWRQSERQKMQLVEKPARAIKTLHKAPLHFSYLLELNTNRVPKTYFLSSESPGQLLEFPSFKLFKNSELSKAFDESGLKLQKNSYGTLLREGREWKLKVPAFENRILWSVDMGFDPHKTLPLKGNRGAVSWSFYPSQISVLEFGDRSNASDTSLTQIQWSEDSEIVAVLKCDSRRLWILENLPNGLSRLFVAEKTPRNPWQLKNYTVFDFEKGPDHGEALAALDRGCASLIVSGTFGALEVQY